MQTLLEAINAIDWAGVSHQMHARGYAIVPKVLDEDQCKELIATYEQDALFRKTVVMERHGYGRGKYRYYQYPLPETLASLRHHLYPQLATIANEWMRNLRIDKLFPDTLNALTEQCHNANQQLPTPLILKYEAGGYNALHQDLYGDVYFPIQVVLVLNKQGKDFTGGEFVLQEQVSRAQSRAVVLNPSMGDLLFFTTSFRPAVGARGYHRLHVKHGVSEVHTGTRYAAGIIFHDATS